MKVPVVFSGGIGTGDFEKSWIEGSRERDTSDQDMFQLLTPREVTEIIVMEWKVINIEN